ncbi:hypothetical protein Tco_0990913 [Tanacetum coccineum]|uniref:Uncharacterized protein n=1 Tax=Tanacetum coccineum TaxID=301880 RepID=A0ABQ5EY62_9ASTR
MSIPSLRPSQRRKRWDYNGGVASMWRERRSFGSISGVGEGKVEFMGGIRGGSFANRSMVAKDGLGGDGFVVDGGRSPSTSSRDGEDGGVDFMIKGNFYKML